MNRQSRNNPVRVERARSESRTVSGVDLFGGNTEHSGSVSTANVLVVQKGPVYTCGRCRKWYHRNVSSVSYCHGLHWGECCHCSESPAEPERDVFGRPYNAAEPDPIIPNESRTERL